MPTDKKSVVAYNNYVKKWADRIRSGNMAAYKFLEKPAMYFAIPNIEGKSVLCVGSGTGEECAYLKSRGAKKVVGIDISPVMVEEARRSYPGIRFLVMDMEKITLPRASFGFVYSSLALHYTRDWTIPLKSIGRVMKKGTIFLFSTHHPIKWGAEVKRWKGGNSFLMGYEKFDKKKPRIYGDYLNTRKTSSIWFNEFRVTYYHKPISGIVRDILKSGFEIIDFTEPRATPAAKKAKPDFYQIHSKIPLFMIFKLRKK